MVRWSSLLALAVFALAGCADTMDASPSPAETGRGPAPRVERFDETWMAGASVGPQVVAVQCECSGHASLDVGRDVTGIVVEMEWASAAASTAEMRLSIRRDYLLPTDEVLAEVEGASPLRLALPASEAMLGHWVVLGAPAGPVGVSKDQPYILHVAWFEGQPFDEGFSSLDAGPGRGPRASGPEPR